MPDHKKIFNNFFDLTYLLDYLSLET